MNIPVLETERLILRGHTLEDFPAFAAMRADPVVMKYLGKGDLLDEEESWLRFQSIAGHWQLKGFGTWAIEERAINAVIGALGYTDKKRPSSHPASGAPEMGWSLAASAHGKGYASEALRAALGWGREHFRTGTCRLRDQRRQRSLAPGCRQARFQTVRDGQPPWPRPPRVRTRALVLREAEVVAVGVEEPGELCPSIR